MTFAAIEKAPQTFRHGMGHCRPNAQISQPVIFQIVDCPRDLFWIMLIEERNVAGPDAALEIQKHTAAF